MKLRRGLIAAIAVVMALVVAPSAQAAFTSLYPGGSVKCKTETSRNNIRACSGFTLTWDHQTKIDVNVFLPAEGGTEGPYPLIGDFHGWGGSKQGLTKVEPGPGLTFEEEDPRIQGWAEKGYAVFSMSDRGWGLSCGKYDEYRAIEAAEVEKEEKEKIVIPGRKHGCEKGFNHLMDDRYEVRDAQYLISELADEGVAEPKKIGATGASYGGGISMALAALRNREMLENGELVPWTSPEGLEMELAAAVPQWPWSDLAYALAPNGRNLDYVNNSPYLGPTGKNPIGVWKASWSKGLYLAGEALSNYATKQKTKEEKEANIPGWIQRLEAGDPYSDEGIYGIINQLTTYHSSFYVNSSVEPSPLLIQSGWNDDLFPVDEALRFYQRTRAQYAGSPISLYLADIGHSRSQNKKADIAAFNQRLEAWFAHYLKGEGAATGSSVEALTTTCPETAPSGGPLQAADWAGLQPGEINLQSSGSQTITHGTNAEESQETTSSHAFDPLKGTKSPCTALATAAVENSHAVTYSLGAAPAGGYTLMGSPTIIANIESPSPNSEIAARLLDVSPEGTESLVARGLYRPTGGSQQMVFQLHPQAYRFAPGHVAKLELLPSDLPYGRYSNLQNNITVSNLEMRLPVNEQPGSLGGLVQKPAAKVVPPGYTLAAEFRQAATPEGGGSPAPAPAPKPPAATVVRFGAAGFAGGFKANRKAVIVPVRCTGEGACSGKVMVRTKRSNGKGLVTLADGSYSLGQNGQGQIRIPLTKEGRKVVKTLLAEGNRNPKLAGVVQLTDSGRPMLTLKRPVRLQGGK